MGVSGENSGCLWVDIPHQALGRGVTACSILLCSRSHRYIFMGSADQRKLIRLGPGDGME